MIYLVQFLSPERIAFLDAATKAEALAALIEMSRSEENIADFDRFRKEVVQREARLTLIIRDPERRKAIVAAESRAQILEQFSGI